MLLLLFVVDQVDKWKSYCHRDRWKRKLDEQRKEVSGISVTPTGSSSQVANEMEKPLCYCNHRGTWRSFVVLGHTIDEGLQLRLTISRLPTGAVNHQLFNHPIQSRHRHDYDALPCAFCTISVIIGFPILRYNVIPRRLSRRLSRVPVST